MCVRCDLSGHLFEEHGRSCAADGGTHIALSHLSARGPTLQSRYPAIRDQISVPLNAEARTCMYHGSISSKVYIDHTLARIFFLRLEGTFRRRFPSSLHICTLGVNFNDGIVERRLTQHTNLADPHRIRFIRIQSLPVPVSGLGKANSPTTGQPN